MLLARADLLEGPQSRSIEAKLTDAATAAKRFMTDRQRELSRTVVPLIQNTMVPGYDAGNACRGTGSHRARVELVENHIVMNKSVMFTKSVGVTLDGLPGMQSAVIEQLMQAAQGGKSAQRVAFSSLWDEAASSPTMLGLHQPSTAQPLVYILSPDDDDVLFIGTRFSNLYTAVDTPAGTNTPISRPNPVHPSAHCTCVR